MKTTTTMQPVLEQSVTRLLARLQTATPRWIIGLAGVPGSGKTTLATQIAAQINARTAPDTLIALGMDGFHLPQAALRQFPDPVEAFARRGAPWTFDVSALHQRLLALRAAAGRTDVAWPGFEHALRDPVEAAYSVPPATRLVIIEGLYLLYQAEGWAAISQCLDERWYLDVPVEVALERLALRHIQAWGMSRAEAEHRIATNDRLNAELVLQSSANADWRLRV